MADLSAADLRVSVICPFFNEEAIIEAATRRMTENLSSQFGNGWELILVNDGSRDQSLARLAALVVDLPQAGHIRILSYPVNQGRGRALKTGIDAARGRLIVTTEVDCSWGDDIAQRLVEELEAHPEADFVIASPHRPGGRLVNVSANRVFLTRMGNLLIRAFFESQVTMNTGMTRGYRRGVIQPLIVRESGKEFHLEVLLKLLALGFRVREIPATLTWQDHKLARDGAAKRKSSTKIFKTIGSHLKFIFIAQPVRYFAWAAAAAAGVGGLFLAAALVMLVTGWAPAIFLALVGLICCLFASILAGFSVVFHQLREIMIEGWMRPYPSPLPPSVRPAEELAPARSTGSVAA